MSLARRIYLCIMCAPLLLIGAVPPASADLYVGSCVIVLSATFSPALTTTLRAGSMSFSTSSSLCAGSGLLGAGAMGGYASGLTSCEAIEVTGTGALSYPPAAVGGMSIIYAGSIGGGAMVLAPGSALILGSGAFAALATGALSCAGTGVSSLTLIGSVTFTDP